MVFKPLLDFICSINKITNPIYPYLPIIYTVTTIIFIILGIAGIIAFAMGNKFKNLARNVYAFVHFITTFLSMLIIFNFTYCSLDIPNNPQGMDKLMPKIDYSSVIRKSKGPKFGGSATPIKEENNTKDTILKMITKVFDFINNLLENNGVPIIIAQVFCTSIIVIIYTFMSCIFRGIAKAGYEMHCADSNQTFLIPLWSTLVDFFMHLFLFISSVVVIFYLILKMAKDGFTALTSGFGLKSCNANTKPTTVQDAMNSLGDNIDHPDIQQGLIKLSYIMNDWPVMRAIFVITLSYYLSQLFLRWLEDIISSNIVLLTSWQKRKTECSDEEDKEKKTSMDRTFILVCNIWLFVQIVISTIVLLVVHIYFFSLIPKILGEFPKIYIPATTIVSLPLTYESVKQTISKVSNGKVNVDKMENQLFRQLSKVTNTNGELDFNTISKMFEEAKTKMTGQSLLDITSPITKRKKVPNPGEQSKLDAEAISKNVVLSTTPVPPPPGTSSPYRIPNHREGEVTTPTLKSYSPDGSVIVGPEADVIFVHHGMKGSATGSNPVPTPPPRPVPTPPPPTPPPPPPPPPAPTP